MTVVDWISETSDRIREDGVAGIRRSLYELYIGGLRRINPLYSRGENIYDREWDVLVLLDACRVDLMREVNSEYDFLGNPDTFPSVGSSSIQWLERTFSDEHAAEMDRTVYVTGNPFSKQVLSDGNLCGLDEVWRYGWDDEVGTIPARHITDRAIAAGRTYEDRDRLIIHYMQPHFPSIPQPLTDGMNSATLGDGEGWESPWHRLRSGELEREIVWSSYRANLEYVLDNVELLLNNLDADRVVISADHANAMGEFGVYGHPKVPLRVLRDVPWYETTATDTGKYKPELEPDDEQEDISAKLSALGYL